MLDANTNGMSDVWEQTRNAVGLAPDVDSDGDGYSNLQESMAGTDPLDPNSYPKITAGSVVGTNIVMNMPSVPGKLYQLQSCTSLNVQPLAWTNEASVIAQPGTTNVSFPEPTAASLGKIFSHQDRRCG